MTHPYHRPCHGGPCTQKAMEEPGFCKCKADAERIAELESTLKAALDVIGHPDDRTVQAMRAVLAGTHTQEET